MKCRFIKLGRIYLNEKGDKIIEGFEKDWQNTGNYSYSEIKGHISKSGNYGVVGGHNDLLIIDIDKKSPRFKEALERMKNLPPTFCVKSARGGFHFYYFSDGEIVNKNLVEGAGEIRADRRMVIGAGSKVDGKQAYFIEKEIPLAKLKQSELDDVFSDWYMGLNVVNSPIKKPKDESRSGREMSEVCKLIKRGLDKEQVFNEMWAFAKWADAPQSYRELTYEKAKKYIEKRTGEKDFDIALLQFTDKLIMAKKFVEIQPLYYDNYKIWWMWIHEENRWKMVDETDILNRIDKHRGQTDTINSKTKNEIVEALKRVARKNQPIPIKETWIQFKDVIVDIETGEEFEVSSKYFATNPIPWELGDSEETPNMERLFSEWVGEENIENLYEIMAFCLVPRYFLHRIFCLIGGGLNGKGTYLRMLQNFIGIENITATDLERLSSSNFECSRLYKKLVCIMGETNTKTIRKTSLLKSLSGEDSIPFEIKHKDPFSGSSYAKIIIASNSLPATMDKTVGWYRRWQIIKFPTEFDEGSDVLKHVTEKEYKNLARRCVNTAKRLWEERKFTNEGSIQDRMDKYEEMSNPIALFIKEMCVKDIDSTIPSYEFFKEFDDFCKSNRYRSMSIREVGLVLTAEGYERRTINKNKHISGLRWGNATDETDKPILPLYPYIGKRSRHDGLTVISVAICPYCGKNTELSKKLDGNSLCEECYLTETEEPKESDIQ